MRFLFRLDLSLHAGAEFFFGILNFVTKHGLWCFLCCAVQGTFSQLNSSSSQLNTRNSVRQVDSLGPATMSLTGTTPVCCSCCFAFSTFTVKTTQSRVRSRKSFYSTRSRTVKHTHLIVPVSPGCKNDQGYCLHSDPYD